MVEIRPGIAQWSWFSQEKGLDFNGLLIDSGTERVLVDPPPMTPAEQKEARAGGPISAVLVTNLHHSRRAVEWRERDGARILVPTADREGFTIPVDGTFSDGDRLPGGLEAIGLEGLKTPGETALFLPERGVDGGGSMRNTGVPDGGGMMILGDALIGKPPGELSLLPPAMIHDHARARESLRRLLDHPWDALLLGDGRSFPQGGRAALQRFLARQD